MKYWELMGLGLSLRLWPLGSELEWWRTPDGIVAVGVIPAPREQPIGVLA